MLRPYEEPPRPPLRNRWAASRQATAPGTACRAPTDTKTTLGLIGELVGLAFPGAEGFEGVVAHERKHGNFALGVRLRNFLVDE